MIDLIIEDGRWAEIRLEVLYGPAGRAAMAVSGRAETGFGIALLAADDTKISQLNQDFRGSSSPTNVLSWPALEDPPLAGGQPDIELGDIAIAYETCVREAAEKGISVQDHVTHLLIHGILHLLGYDHISDADAQIMEALEIKALAKLGIGNPY